MYGNNIYLYYASFILLFEESSCSDPTNHEWERHGKHTFLILILCKSLNITNVVQIEIEMFFPLHCSFGRVRMKGKLWLDN